ncbi:MAG: CopG family transcriptional regulator [Desertimonas sp.]
MRTTIEFDRDTARAIEQARREEGKGVSEVVNDLIRRGLSAPHPERLFVPTPHDLGITIDVSNIADALDLLEGPHAR